MSLLLFRECEEFFMCYKGLRRSNREYLGDKSNIFSPFHLFFYLLNILLLFKSYFKSIKTNHQRDEVFLERQVRKNILFCRKLLGMKPKLKL